MRLIHIIFVLVFISTISFADSIVVNLPPSTCNASSGILTAITNIPQCTSEAIFTSLTNGLIFSAQQFYDLSIGFLTASPDIRWFCSPYTMIMAIIESFYSIMLMGLGAYYVINAADVEGRTKAKMWLKSVFFMVVFLSFSFTIFGLMLDLNTQISSSIYSAVSSSIFDINATLSDLIFSLIFALSLSIGGWMTFSTLILRYILLPFLLFLFPIAIFLYFMPPTREWGAFIFKFIALVVFMTTVDSILLLGISYLFASPDPNLANPLVRSFGLMAGFGLIGIVNMILYAIASITIISKAVKSLESAMSLLMKAAIALSFL